MPKKDATTEKVAREVERSGALCLAFANSAAPRTDRRTRAKGAPGLTLRAYDDLVAWGQRMGVLDGRDGEALSRTAAARRIVPGPAGFRQPPPAMSCCL